MVLFVAGWTTGISVLTAGLAVVRFDRAMKPLGSSYFHLTDVLQTLLGAAWGLSWFSALVTLAGRQTSRGWERHPEDATPGGLLSIDFIDTFARLGLYVGLVVTGALFGWWLYRGLLDPRLEHPTAYPAWWAVAGWFVPVANLVMPYLMVRQLWQGAQRRRTQTTRVPWVMPVWWASFLMSAPAVAIAWYARRWLTSGSEAHAFGSVTNYYTASTICFVLVGCTAGLAVLMVHRVTESLKHLGS